MTIFSSSSSSKLQENSAIQRQMDFHLTVVVVVGPAVEIVSRNAVNFQRQTDEALDDEGNVNTREEEAARERQTPNGVNGSYKELVQLLLLRCL
jgi:hypothetical protein